MSNHPLVVAALANGVITDPSCTFAHALVTLSERRDHGVNLSRIVSPSGTQEQRVMAVLLANGIDPITTFQVARQWGPSGGDPIAALATEMGIMDDVRKILEPDAPSVPTAPKSKPSQIQQWAADLVKRAADRKAAPPIQPKPGGAGTPATPKPGSGTFLPKKAGAR